MWVRTCQGLDFVVDDDTLHWTPLTFNVCSKRHLFNPFGICWFVQINILCQTVIPLSFLTGLSIISFKKLVEIQYSTDCLITKSGATFSHTRPGCGRAVCQI